MLANFFDKTKPINSIVLFLFFSSIYFAQLQLRKPSVFTQFYWLKTILYFLFNTSFLIAATYFFVKNGVSNENLYNTFFMILLYVIFTNAFDINNYIFISFLFLLTYNNLAKLKTKNASSLILFDAGIFAGISFFLLNWSILFLLFIIGHLIIRKKINLFTILKTIIGFLVPVLVMFTYYFITDNTMTFFEHFTFNYDLSFEYFTNPHFQAGSIVITILVAISIFSVLPKVLSISDSYRHQYILTLTMLAIGIAIVHLIPHKTGSELLLLFVPISIVLGKFLTSITHQGLKEFLLIGFTIFSMLIFISNT